MILWILMGLVVMFCFRKKIADRFRNRNRNREQGNMMEGQGNYNANGNYNAVIVQPVHLYTQPVYTSQYANHNQPTNFIQPQPYQPNAMQQMYQQPNIPQPPTTSQMSSDENRAQRGNVHSSNPYASSIGE